MSLVEELKTTLADVFSFYVRAHGYHWNVEGADFRQYHGMFEEIYADAYASIDPLAENIRKLGEYVPFRLERFAEAKTIPDRQKIAPDAKALANDLLECNEALVERLKATFRVANEADEQGIANFLAERIDAHQKWSWFLRASVK